MSNTGSEPTTAPSVPVWRGVAYMVASAAGFSVMSVLVKLATETLPTSEVVLARGVLTLVITAAWLLPLRVSPLGNDRRRLVARGIFGTLGLGCFFVAISRLDLAEATILHYLNPVLTAALAVPLLGERLTRGRVLALLFGLGGVAAVVSPRWTGTSSIDGVGIAIAVAGAFFAAAAYVTVRQLRHTEHPLVVVFYFPLVTVPVTLPWAWGSLVMPTPLEWTYLVGMAVGTQVGQVFLTRGLHALAAAPAMAVSYLQIVFAVSWGVLLWGETPRAATLIGGLLIVGGAWLGVRRSRRSQSDGGGGAGPGADPGEVDGVDDEVSGRRGEGST